jgi:hypothetical protein
MCVKAFVYDTNLIGPPSMYPHNLRAYYTGAGKEIIGGGPELWRGFFQYVNPCAVCLSFKK